MSVETVDEKQSLSIIPTAMLNRLKKLDDESGNLTKQQFLDICNVYLPEAFRYATRQKVEKRKLPDIKREAGLVAMLAIVSAQHLNVNLKTLTTPKKVKEVILKGTGLFEIQTWLEKQKTDRDVILTSSGKQRIIESLLKLRYIPETQDYFDSFERMRTVTSELFEWLKVVAALNRNATTHPQFQRLAISIGGGTVWNKDRVYFSLIIGITLHKDKVQFSLSDILRFCTVVQQDAWIPDIRTKLSGIIVEDLQTSLADITSVKSILNDMNMFHNKTVFYYAKKVGLVNSNEDQLLRTADVILTRGALAVSRYTGHKTDKKVSLELKKKVSASLGNQSMAVTYQFLLKYPYLLGWLTEQELFRMAVFDRFNDNQLAVLTSSFGDEKAFNNHVNRINQKVTIAEVIHDIINDRELFGTNIAFLLKNKSLTGNRKKNLNDVEKKKVYKNIMTNVSRLLSPTEFSQWASEIEGKNGSVGIDLTGVNISHIAAIYLMEKGGKCPKVILAAIEKEPWAKYIDEYALEYFRQKIGSVQKS